MKLQQGVGKEYVCVARLHSSVTNLSNVSRALETLIGIVFQRLPLILTIKIWFRIKIV